jgi:TetR/AcrR family transcriptional repressor of mexJK operon
MPNANSTHEEGAVDLRIAKSAQTRERIIISATELFLGDGYSNTSLDNVASEAGVTKPTVYSHFRSKKGLFDAVIRRFTSSPIKEISEFLEPSEDPRSDLIEFGDFFIVRSFQKDALRWKRLAAAESMTHPEVGEAFYKAGPAQLLSRLAKYFDLQTQAGRLNVVDSASSAEQFIGMLLGLDLLRSQIGQPLPSAAKRKRRCRDAVDLFMSTHGAKS